MNKFLPDVKVTTIIWGEKDTLKHSKWEATQGDDLKNQRPTVELNLAKLAQRGEAEKVAKAMVESWLSIWIVFATRQDLIDKKVRGAVSAEAHKILYDANFKTIMESPMLKRGYADLAMDEILDGKWVIDESHKQLSDEVRSLLSTWRRVSDELDSLRGRCYLCGSQLLSPEADPAESLKFATETPYAKLTPTPFIESVVSVCPKCLPLAKEMGLDAKSLTIETRG